MKTTENDIPDKTGHHAVHQNDVIINITPPPSRESGKQEDHEDDEDYEDLHRGSTSAEETEYSSASLSSSEDEASISNCASENNGKTQNKRCSHIDKKGNINLTDLGYDSGVLTHDEDEDDDGKSSLTCHYDHETLPNDLKILFDGRSKDVSIVFRDKKPDWFDIDKYRTGQIFAEKYYFCINFAEMISLFLLFSFELNALMFTNKSGTPFTAFKRYLSTVLRVKSWFDTDIFDRDSVGYNNINIVRSMHRSVDKQMSSLSRKEIEDTINKYNDREKFTCPFKESIREDFKNNTQCPFVCVCSKDPKKAFNQCSMSITQFGFIGLIVTFPEKLGVGSATEEELDGFVHLWKTIGYLLGIDDKYNFCSGSLNDVRQRSKNLINYLVVPNFGNVDDDWEHYSRCVVKGISYYVPDITFEMSLLYICYTLDIDAKKIKSKTSWKTYFHFNLYKLMCGYLFKYQCILNFFNRLLNKSLMRAKNFSNEKLQKLENVSNDYMHL